LVDSLDSKVGKQSIRASFVLFTGNLISTLLLAITVFILGRLLGPYNYGEYTIALVIPGTFVLLVGLGINTALMRFSSYHLSRGEVDIARRMSRSASYMLLLIGVIMSAINFLGANFFSVFVFHRPALVPLVQLASLEILGQAMIQASDYGFIGWNSPGFASLDLIVQAVVKISLSPLLVILGFSVFGAILAHVVSYVFGGALFFALFSILKLRGKRVGSARMISDVKEMISFGLPEYGGRIISQISQQSYIFIILAAIATNVTIAYFQAAYNITTILGIISVIIGQVLLSAFANLDGAGGNIQLAFALSQKYTLYVVTPIIFFFIGTSNLLMEVFYGRAYLGGTIYLQALCVSFLPFAFGAAVVPPLFNGLAKTKLTLQMFSASSITLFILAPLLSGLLRLSAIGLVISLFIANLVQLIVGMDLARRHVAGKFQYRNVARALIAAGVSYVGIYAVSLFKLSFINELLLQLVVFLVVYLTISPIFRVLDTDEFSQLKSSTEAFGFFGKIISLVLRYEIFVVRKTSRN
jgi:O-antigen/teichoic acid export membrane protein